MKSAPTDQVDDWYGLENNVGCFVRRVFGQQVLLSLLIFNMSVRISWAIICCH